MGKSLKKARLIVKATDSCVDNLNDINCGHVRKCVMLSIIFWTIFIRFGSNLYTEAKF